MRDKDRFRALRGLDALFGLTIPLTLLGRVAEVIE
jgi:hypothetical protein